MFTIGDNLEQLGCGVRKKLEYRFVNTLMLLLCNVCNFRVMPDSLPIFEIPPPKYTAEQILRILLDPYISESKICNVRPVNITQSATYVVNIQMLEHQDDIKNDNFGKWQHSGSHPLLFRVQMESDDYMYIEKCAPGATGENVVMLRRLHSVHPSNCHFKRLIAFVSGKHATQLAVNKLVLHTLYIIFTYISYLMIIMSSLFYLFVDASNNPHYLCLVVYHLPKGFVPTVKCHGNSKAGIPFHPTWSSTKLKIKDKCTTTEGPKHIVSSVSDASGGIVKASAPGQLPRDEKQISNFKGKMLINSRKLPVGDLSRDAAGDNLFVVMQQAFTEDPSKKFIRAVNAAPEPAVVVATDSQLNDLVRFCTSPFEFSVLTVDPTFCLGDFDVTLVTYRNLFLQTKRLQQPPVIVGPALIHFKKSFATYLFFASTLIGQCRELERVRVLGTDGEKALLDAFKHEFGFAQHLTCFIHVRRNVKDKLNECNISTQFATEILDDVFGKKIGTLYVEGLVDADDVDDFDAKMESLLTKWRDQDGATTSVSDIDKFFSWFQSYKVPIIRSSMIKGVREECGLGSPPTPFTTNASETANYMLKHKVNYKQSELPEFLEKFKELLLEQEQEVKKAILGRGKYELRSQYQSWHVSEAKWFSMTTVQRQQHLQKFSAASVEDISHCEGDAAASICIGRDQSLSSSLSVDFTSLTGSTRIPLNCLQGIWNKAAELLKTDNAIVMAPGNYNGAKFVLSYRGSKPHLVTPKKTEVFACDSDCANWKGLGICAHSVAVAEMSGRLPEFIERVKKVKKTPMLSKFAEATMPKGRGRKGGEISRKRKTPSVIETRVQNPSIPCNESSQDVWPAAVSQSQMSPYGFQQGNTSNIHSPFYFNSPSMVYSMPGGGWPYGHYPCTSGFTSATSSSPPITPFTPFTLCKISGNISVCSGCRNKYNKNSVPPDDMCIRHQEWREYTPPGSQVPQGRFGNVYYHFNVHCVWLHCSSFNPSQLEIPPDIIPLLEGSHKARLSAMFGIDYS